MDVRVTTLRSTGVDSLDALLDGGLPSECLHLLEGPPGSGRTTLALQFLLEGAQNGESGLMITASQSRRELERIARSHGFDLGPVSIEEISPLDLVRGTSPQQSVLSSTDVERPGILEAIQDMVERASPDRLVIDSLEQLRLLTLDELAPVRGLLLLKSFVARAGTCALLIDSIAPHGHRAAEGLVSGIIRLDAEEGADRRLRRTLKVRKMRGNAVVGDRQRMTIGTGGIVLEENQS